MRFSFKSFLSLNPTSLTTCTILLVVILFLTGTPILDLIELKTYDLRFLSRGQLQPKDAGVMALIDEKSLDTEGRWPWPRSRLATLVGILSRRFHARQADRTRLASRCAAGPSNLSTASVDSMTAHLSSSGNCWNCFKVNRPTSNPRRSIRRITAGTTRV